MLSLTPQLARPSERPAERAFGADPCAASGRAIPGQVDLAQLGRGPSLTQVISSDVSDASAIPHRTDDLDAGGRIWHGRMRLRALWTSRSVVVRVHSGALERPCKSGLFVVKGVSTGARGDCSFLGHWPNRTICRTFRGPDVRRQGQWRYAAEGLSDLAVPNKMGQICRGQRGPGRCVDPQSGRPGGVR